MKILFLQKRVLFPVDTGWRVRTLNILRFLAQWHQVTYLCNLAPHEEGCRESMESLGVRLETVPFEERRSDSAAFYVEALRNLFSTLPFPAQRCYDRRLKRRAAELLADGGYDLVICDFVQMAVNLPAGPTPPKILFQHNVEADVLSSYAASTTGLRRAYAVLQGRRMARFESQTGRRFDAVIAVSRADRETFEKRYGWTRVDVIDTAVNTRYFVPAAAQERAGQVVFVGSMDWPPNQDAARHFVEQIWPRIRNRHPGARFEIVGRHPPARVYQLANVPGVRVTGTVPDVRPFLATAAVVVVPLLAGGGTRLKIFEAMAMEKAVVSTPLGAAGLDVRDGAHLLLEESARGFADAVCGLLDDAGARARLGQAARRWVCERYSAEQVARQFDDVCRSFAAAMAPSVEAS